MIEEVVVAGAGEAGLLRALGEGVGVEVEAGAGLRKAGHLRFDRLLSASPSL